MTRTALCIFALVLSTACGARAQGTPPDEAWEADARLMLDTLERGHANLDHSVPVATLRADVAEWIDRLPERDRAERIVELARIVARVGDGHTRLYLVPTRSDSALGFRMLPVGFTRFADGVYVTSSTPAFRALVGSTVTGIGVADIAQAHAALAPFAARDSGNLQRVVNETERFLRVADVLRAAGVSSRADSVALELRDASGSRRSIMLPSLRWDSAFVGPPEGFSLPLHARNSSSPFWLEWLPETATLYVHLRSVANGPTETLHAFTERVLASIDSAQARRVILDLRHNPGGDHSLVGPLVEGLRERPINRDGGIYVVIGRGTFSAALWTALDFDTQTRAILVGGDTGGRPNWYGETRHVVLPGTGLRVSYASRFNRRTAGDDRRPALSPDVAIESTGADYFRGRDAVLDWILARPLP